MFGRKIEILINRSSGTSRVKWLLIQEIMKLIKGFGESGLEMIGVKSMLIAIVLMYGV